MVGPVYEVFFPPHLGRDTEFLPGFFAIQPVALPGIQHTERRHLEFLQHGAEFCILVVFIRVTGAPATASPAAGGRFLQEAIEIARREARQIHIDLHAIYSTYWQFIITISTKRLTR